MTVPDQIDLLRKFISNTCTPEELHETERLLASGIEDSVWTKVLSEHEKTIEGIEFSSSSQVKDRLVRIREYIFNIEKNGIAGSFFNP